MGEYIKDVKIGTCEDLYYTTYNQLKTWKPGGIERAPYLNVDSGDRFRFPFPDEKEIKIGDYQDFDRGYLIELPKGMLECNHNEVFIRTDTLKLKGPAMGFRIACPASMKKAFRWNHEETESFEIVQQKYVTDEQVNRKMLHTVFRCPYCGCKFRADIDEAINICEFLKQESQKFAKTNSLESNDKALELMQIANTIMSGYTMGLPEDK